MKYDFCYLCRDKVTKTVRNKAGKRVVLPLPRYTCVEVGLRCPEGETVFVTPTCRSCALSVELNQKAWPALARRVLKYSTKEGTAPSFWTNAQKSGNYEVVGVFDITQKLVENKVIRE